jgi:hypothetical protein
MLGFGAAPVVTREAKRSEARMLTKTWRRSSSPAAWALVLTLGAPALVQAQTQLFPLAPIRRERVPCPVEDPVYGMYRHQYFGYFPTCWRTFPPGWGCPSSEGPNLAKSFADQPRDKPREVPLGPEEEGPMPGEEPSAPGRRPQFPPLPEGRSPFDMEPAPKPDANPPGNPGERPPRQGRANPPAVAAPTPTTASRVGPAPATAPGAPAAGASAGDKDVAQPDGGTAPLLALPDPAEAAPAATPPGLGNGNGNGNSPDVGVGAVPGPSGITPLEHTGALPGPLGPPTVSMSSPPTPALNPNDGQTQPMMARPANPGGMLPAESALAPIASAPVQRPPAPVQAPQRRGPISTLFNGMTSWLRR